MAKAEEIGEPDKKHGSVNNLVEMFSRTRKAAFRVVTMSLFCTQLQDTQDKSKIPQLRFTSCGMTNWGCYCNGFRCECMI